MNKPCRQAYFFFPSSSPLAHFFCLTPTPLSNISLPQFSTVTESKMAALYKNVHSCSPNKPALQTKWIGFESDVALQRFGVTVKLTAYQLLVFIVNLSYHSWRQGESMCKWKSSAQIKPWRVVNLSSNIFLAPSSLGKSLICCVCNFYNLGYNTETNVYWKITCSQRTSIIFVNF